MARYKLPIPSLAGTLVLTTTGAAFASAAEPVTAQPTATSESSSTAAIGTGVDASEPPPTNLADPTTTSEVPEPPPAPAVEPAETVAEPPTPAVTPTTAPTMEHEEHAHTHMHNGPVSVRVEAKPEEAPHSHAILLLPAKTKRRYMELNAGSVYSLGGFSGPFGGQGFQLEQVIGRYVGKSKTDGLGIGFTVIERFSAFNDYTLGVRFQWDKPLSKDLGIYVSNGFTLGGNLLTYGSGVGYYSYGGIGLIGFGLDMAYNLGAKIVVKDRLILSFRPVNLDVTYLFPAAYRVRWSVMGGLGFSW